LLLNWPPILVKPMQGFLDEFVAREIVAGVIENMFFSGRCENLAAEKMALR
jgi:hypothetical protein